MFDRKYIFKGLDYRNVVCKSFHPLAKLHVAFRSVDQVRMTIYSQCCTPQDPCVYKYIYILYTWDCLDDSFFLSLPKKTLSQGVQLQKA